MADVFHTFPIHAPLEKVYACISTPAGLDKWWTKTCSGKTALNEVYHLGFGPEYHWEGKVSIHDSMRAFEFTMTKSDDDWKNSKVGFILHYENGSTEVQFYHTGWKENNDHFRISSFCWAMYLRILKRYLEFGEEVDYEERLES